MTIQEMSDLELATIYGEQLKMLLQSSQNIQAIEGELRARQEKASAEKVRRSAPASSTGGRGI